MLYTNLIWAAVVLFGLFILLLSSAIIGRRFGEWQVEHNPQHKIEIVTVAEGAVFALLGLLIAFTFTSAYDRFENRKMYIIDEANAINTADLRLGMLPAEQAQALRTRLKEYVDLRLDLYSKLPDVTAASVDFEQLRVLRVKLWDEVLAATQNTNVQATTMLVLPAMNNLFDIANTRIALTKIHSPLAIFALLVCIAMLSTFLAGYSTAGSKTNYSIHILSYVVICAVTIYVIIDLEMPRVGLINVNAFDITLQDARAEML